MMFSNINVLIVDDERVIREMLQDFLEDYEITVYLSGTGKEALQKLEKHPIHLTIVDLRMDDMTGIEFIHKAKINSDTKYLIYTGSTDYTLSGDLLELGITQQDVLFKPANMMFFIDAIERMFGDRKNENK